MSMEDLKSNDGPSNADKEEILSFSSWHNMKLDDLHKQRPSQPPHGILPNIILASEGLLRNMVEGAKGPLSKLLDDNKANPRQADDNKVIPGQEHETLHDKLKKLLNETDDIEKHKNDAGLSEMDRQAIEMLRRGKSALERESRVDGRSKVSEAVKNLGEQIIQGALGSKPAESDEKGPFNWDEYGLPDLKLDGLQDYHQKNRNVT